MIIRHTNDLTEADVTPEPLYQERRTFIRQGVVLAGSMLCAEVAGASNDPRPALDYQPGAYSSQEETTALADITGYANFYEFGSGKNDPARNSKQWVTDSWSVTVRGEAERTGQFTLEDILKPHPLEERIYRLRCVETWSMVIPWIGFPLADFIKRCQPTSKAKYIAFETLHDPQQMPAQRGNLLTWPYTEGLRMDEALHPLTLLVVGLYGKILPAPNGAPLRLVVPWKYGFKSIKSIVAVDFVEDRPATTWNRMAPDEYGFYANVNPQVDHPRWSQKRERRIGQWTKRDTELFNGYAEQVAHLYQGMDLRTWF